MCICTRFTCAVELAAQPNNRTTPSIVIEVLRLMFSFLGPKGYHFQARFHARLHDPAAFSVMTYQLGGQGKSLGRTNCRMKDNAKTVAEKRPTTLERLIFATQETQQKS